jgi:predicted Zn-dependent protease
VHLKPSDNPLFRYFSKTALSRSGRGLSGLLVLGLVQGCSLTNSIDDAAPKSYSSSFIKAEDSQSKIGEKEHPIVLAKYGGEYRNKEAETLLAIIVGRLVAASEDKQQVYKITILNTPKVNAFALPGGYLYVTRGLLALANDTSELAAVIAHEMAHVASNHAILRNRKQASTDVGKQVVSDVLSDNVAGRIALAANQIKLSDFSKDQELQADAVGIRTLGNAGFDAFGAARFLETMQAYKSLNATQNAKFSDTAFLSSHPATPERIELAKRHARFFGAPGTLEADHDRYLKGIDGMLYGDSAEEGFVRDNSFSHLGLGVTFNATKGSKIENQATAVVISSPNDLATRFDAAVLPKGQDLASYLKSGWVKGLDESSIITGNLNDLPIASATAKGGNWNFVVRVIQLDRQVYRFITAGPINNTDIERTSSEITGSFRRLTEAEKLSLQPLKIRIVQVQSSDSLATLSAKMKGVDNPLRRFLVLNGLSAGQIPSTGTKVKIVSDQ